MRCFVLRSRLTDIKSTREGVKSSIGIAYTEVEEKFKLLRNEVAQMLDCREKAILTTITEIERKDLDPLNNLEDKINRELDKTVKLLEKGKRLLSIIINFNGFYLMNLQNRHYFLSRKKQQLPFPFYFSLYSLATGTISNCQQQNLKMNINIEIRSFSQTYL